MTHAEAGSSGGARGGADRGANWPTAIASLCVGAGFLALWFWLLPGWLGFRGYASGAAGWRLIFAIPAALGFAVAIKCIWDFGWTGHGTPATMAAAAEARGGGVLSLRAESDVYGIFCGLV